MSKQNRRTPAHQRLLALAIETAPAGERAWVEAQAAALTGARARVLPAASDGVPGNERAYRRAARQVRRAFLDFWRAQPASAVEAEMARLREQQAAAAASRVQQARLDAVMARVERRGPRVRLAA